MAITYALSKQGIDQLNSYFTTMYAYKNWLYRLKVLEFVIKNPKEFIKELGDAEITEKDEKAIELSLKGEVYFTFFHMTEALFCLVYCAYRAQVPWVQMKGFRVKSLCEFVQNEVITGKISDEQLRHVFFNGIIGEEARKPEITESLEFIKEYLKRIGELFLKNKVYGEYKHGLRVMATTSRFTISPENIPNAQEILSRVGNAVVYLDTDIIHKEGKEEYHQVKQITDSFDYELFLRLCYVNIDLLSNIFETRRQGENANPGDMISVKTYPDCDCDEIFKENPAGKFSFTIKYPTAEPVSENKNDEKEKLQK